MFSKKIVAAAALLALTAGAQAGVTVYGAVDMSFGSFKPAGGKATTRVESGSMMTSFIGFSGSEDLGGGLKAEFALESFLAGDTGGTLNNMAKGFWGRASNVALSGAFGKIAIGQYDNALFTSGYTYNPFGSSMMFSPTMRHYYGLGTGIAGGVIPAALSFDTGWVNSLTYETPNMGGFTASLQWSPKESSTEGAKDSFTAAAAYNAGPLSLMAVFVNAGQTDTSTAYLYKQSVYSLNASYDFGVAKGFFQYTDVDTADTAILDYKLFQIGASVPVSEKGSVLVSYGQGKLDALDASDKIFSIGYDHFLSKRTDVYVALTNEKATDLSGATSFAVGIKHAF
jgi:predicted porin